MGYVQNLKNILDCKGMTVKELILKAKIASTTPYSIIQRDASIRFDTAIRISNILDIPISSICKDNPYDDIETLPALPSDIEKRNIDSHKNNYISDRIACILQKI
ncbi:MAG: helix-turn-helix transcriptional regulator [Lachnospiraceae bacterium]|nr:helix-turn-helix transcriptional regulator [Lachnospiraceae bacterium]MDE7239113.1 helix-turn-helix transcriptional regulator [Lachnospiraceae bacterium]